MSKTPETHFLVYQSEDGRTKIDVMRVGDEWSVLHVILVEHGVLRQHDQRFVGVGHPGRLEQWPDDA